MVNLAAVDIKLNTYPWSPYYHYKQKAGCDGAKVVSVDTNSLTSVGSANGSQSPDVKDECLLTLETTTFSQSTQNTDCQSLHSCSGSRIRSYDLQPCNISTAVSSLLTPPESPSSQHFTSNGFISAKISKLGLHNILNVSEGNVDQYFFTRQCCYIFHCARLNVNFKYPGIPLQVLLKNERVHSAIEETVLDEMEKMALEGTKETKVYSTLVARHKARVRKVFQDMRSTISTTLIRITAYVLFKVFNRLFMSLTVHKGQLEMIQKAATRNIPLIFMPLHRSHVDYLFVTWVLVNREIPAPIVAAGDNLRIPVFGSLLRGLGGFFIKRKLESSKSQKDILYRALLQTYISTSLQAGYNLEFFIEGGRTRTGKPCLPKGGLLSVIVDACLCGTLDDALIVPIAINYDRLVDGNFIHEQLGQSKVPESFWGAVCAIIKIFSTNYGHSRIDFAQPFSLREFVNNSKVSHLCQTSRSPQGDFTGSVIPTLGTSTPPYEPADMGKETSMELPKEGTKSHSRSLSSPGVCVDLAAVSHGHCNPPVGMGSDVIPMSSMKRAEARSNSSLFGKDLTEDYRQLVKSLASHIVYDAERCQAIMSTNAIAWLLSFAHRDGVSLDTLVSEVENLVKDLRARGRDVGFSGSSKDVTLHGLSVLGSGLVQMDGVPPFDDHDLASIFVKPVTVLPSVLELNYYASALLAPFAIDAVVGTCLITLTQIDLWSYRDCDTECFIAYYKLLERSKQLCSLLEYEFLFVPSCGNLEDKIRDAIDRLVIAGLLTDARKDNRQWYRYEPSGSSDEDDPLMNFSSNPDRLYHLTPKTSNTRLLCPLIRMLTPIIEAYYGTFVNLHALINQPMKDRDFIHDTQKIICSYLEKGTLTHSESIAADPIKNAMKLLEKRGVVEMFSQDNIQLVYLTHAYESEERLHCLVEEIDSFKV